MNFVKIEMSEDIKELLNNILEDELERKIVLRVLSEEDEEKILEELLEYLRHREGDTK